MFHIYQNSKCQHLSITKRNSNKKDKVLLFFKTLLQTNQEMAVLLAFLTGGLIFIFWCIGCFCCRQRHFKSYLNNHHSNSDQSPSDQPTFNPDQVESKTPPDLDLPPTYEEATAASQ